MGSSTVWWLCGILYVGKCESVSHTCCIIDHVAIIILCVFIKITWSITIVGPQYLTRSEKMCGISRTNIRIRLCFGTSSCLIICFLRSLLLSRDSREHVSIGNGPENMGICSVESKQLKEAHVKIVSAAFIFLILLIQLL